ncbi:hypothetical protein B0H17DRAFT_1149705 [Mycena rosella]|uniref:Uncharacterized protein n=1 Tax=Mycena rosella TaxID=1033263 RepID=A0AAD7BYI8_MYCRO|nr:hypothetical protein B0H17DRAFT_1149705 [Mycena rosella]
MGFEASEWQYKSGHLFERPKSAEFQPKLIQNPTSNSEREAGPHNKISLSQAWDQARIIVPTAGFDWLAVDSATSKFRPEACISLGKYTGLFYKIIRQAARLCRGLLAGIGLAPNTPGDLRAGNSTPQTEKTMGAPCAASSLGKPRAKKFPECRQRQAKGKGGIANLVPRNVSVLCFGIIFGIGISVRKPEKIRSQATPIYFSVTEI